MNVPFGYVTSFPDDSTVEAKRLPVEDGSGDVVEVDGAFERGGLGEDLGEGVGGGVRGGVRGGVVEGAGALRRDTGASAPPPLSPAYMFAHNPGVWRFLKLYSTLTVLITLSGDTLLSHA